MNWGKNTQPFNNAIQGGSLGFSGPKTPIISVQDTANFQIGLSKRTATGAQLGIVHNVNWLYQNSTFLVTPSVYTTNIQMTLTQPLMGSAPLPGQPVNNFSNLVGLEANRAPIVIARLEADQSVWSFKLNVMEMVRSIEQQYWILARKHIQLWSSEKAVDLAREIVNREQAELVVGKGTVADVAEAVQRLEQFSLDLVTRTSDLLTTERQMRNLLGLPPADNRRIIPVTPPTEARLEPDWDASLAQMLSFYPDIVQQEIAVRVAELQLVIARNQLLPQLNLNLLYQLNGLGQQLDSAESVMTGATIKALDPVVAAKERAAGLLSNPGFYNNFRTWQVGFTFQMPLGMRSPLANTRFAQYGLLRQRAFLQQMVHQRTHQLARYFLEIDANYKQFKTASRLRAAAAQRLDAQRAYYEEGRITIDRFLDAVSQYAQAVATEAEHKTSYNISIIVFEEAKGTLLAYNNIAVAEGPLPRKAYVQARDIQNAHRKLPIPHDGPMYNRRSPDPSIPIPFRPTRRRGSSPATSPPCRPRGARSDRRPRPQPPIARPASRRFSRRSRPRAYRADPERRSRLDPGLMVRPCPRVGPWHLLRPAHHLLRCPRMWSPGDRPKPELSRPTPREQRERGRMPRMSSPCSPRRLTCHLCHRSSGRKHHGGVRAASTASVLSALMLRSVRLSSASAASSSKRYPDARGAGPERTRSSVMGCQFLVDHGLG